MKVGRYYLVKCGWGNTVAKLEYIIEGVYYFKAKNGFRFLSNDLNDVQPV